MVRKILYALLAISLVIVINQVVHPEVTIANSTTNGPAATSTSSMTGTVEVRLSASSFSEEVASVIITISSVEIHKPNGWTKLQMVDSNTIDLKQIEGLEQTVGTINLDQGTYTQIRLNIARIDVTLSGGHTIKAKLSASRLSFTQNFIVNYANATVLVVNFDSLNSFDLSVKNQVTFKPVANLWVTRSPGSMELITTNLPQAEIGVAYYAMLMTIGGQRPYSWSIIMGDLPPGLTLDSESGVISGIPTTTGNFTFSARADDSSPIRKSTVSNLTRGVVNANEPGINIQITQ